MIIQTFGENFKYTYGYSFSSYDIKTILLKTGFVLTFKVIYSSI